VLYFGLGLFALGSFVAASATGIWMIVLGRMIQGSGAISAVAIALTADLTRESQRSKAMALIGSTIGVAFALSLVAGPPLNEAIGVSGIFVMTGALALGAMIVVRTLVPEPPARDPEAAPSDRAPRRGTFFADLKAVFAEPDLLRLNFGVLVVHALLTALFLVVPVSLRDAGLPVVSHWQVYWPAMLVSFAVLVPVIAVSERRQQVKLAFLASIAVTLLSVAWFALAIHSVAGIAVALALFFIGFNLLEALLPSLVSRVAPQYLRGTAVGVYSSIQFLGIFLGGAVGGVLAQTFGLGAVLWSGAALTAVWLGVSLRLRPLVARGNSARNDPPDVERVDVDPQINPSKA
jgi:predicted MFS family arabinose efflux permease